VNTQNKNKDTFVMEVYIRHRQELCAYIISKFGVDASDAEDIVQSAFAKFAESEGVLSIENPRAFLYKACSNIAIDIKRHNKVRHGYSAEVFELEEEATDSVGPERASESRQRLGIIAQVMWAMPTRRRQLLMMNRFDGLSYAEIARQVGLSETVVRKHIAKALEECRKALKACGE
jgi:RNA polymerase sigma-70 factor (ECF subfamily)